VKAWLADNPRVSFHFTPIGSSWMNQIEIWFGIITRQAIRRGTFSSVTVLIKQIRDYITHWNTHARPFRWTATADDILAKVRLVLQPQAVIFESSLVVALPGAVLVASSPV